MKTGELLLLIIDGYNCKIHCFHDKCQKNKVYEGIETEFNSLLKYFLVTRNFYWFKYVNLNIIDIYKKYL